MIRELSIAEVDDTYCVVKAKVTHSGVVLTNYGEHIPLPTVKSPRVKLKLWNNRKAAKARYYNVVSQTSKKLTLSV